MLCLFQNKQTSSCLGFLSGVYNLIYVLIMEQLFRPWACKLGYFSSASCGLGWWVCIEFWGEGDVKLNTLCWRNKSRMGKDWIWGWGGEEAGPDDILDFRVSFPGAAVGAEWGGDELLAAWGHSCWILIGDANQLLLRYTGCFVFLCVCVYNSTPSSISLNNTELWTVVAYLMI